MYVHRRRKRIEIWTPAKLNLYLEVLGRRADGYHEIETLMVPIGLFDTLQLFERDDDRLVLSTRWARPTQLPVHGSSADHGYDSASRELPPPEQNLVYRAVELLRRRAGVLHGIEMCLTKRIPTAAGLGGGSSDAAAALWGANLVWGLQWSRERLADLAADLGSDVPFFFYGSAARCRGRGERIEPLDLGNRQHFVVLRPRQGLSTASVYALTQVSASPRHALDSMKNGWGRRPTDIVRHMFNRLQEAAEQRAPWIRSVQQQFNRLDLLGHQMSGSGSAFFGVCRNAKHACRVAAVLRGRSGGQVFHVASVMGGQHRVLPVSQN